LGRHGVMLVPGGVVRVVPESQSPNVKVNLVRAC